MEPPLNAIMENQGEGMESKGSPIWAILVGSKKMTFPSQELDCVILVSSLQLRVVYDSMKLGLCGGSVWPTVSPCHPCSHSKEEGSALAAQVSASRCHLHHFDLNHCSPTIPLLPPWWTKGQRRQNEPTVPFVSLESVLAAGIAHVYPNLGLLGIGALFMNTPGPLSNLSSLRIFQCASHFVGRLLLFRCKIVSV